MELPDRLTDRLLHLSLRRNKPRRNVAAVYQNADCHITQFWRMQLQNDLVSVAAGQFDQMVGESVGQVAKRRLGYGRTAAGLCRGGPSSIDEITRCLGRQATGQCRVQGRLLSQSGSRRSRKRLCSRNPRDFFHERTRQEVRTGIVFQRSG